MSQSKFISFGTERQRKLERIISAFVEGYIGFKNGSQERDCPYDFESDFSIAWTDGWNEAFEDSAQGSLLEPADVQKRANELFA